MLLEQLTIENLGVFGGTKKLELGVKPSRPIVLCGGDNGAGKTTIFESVLLCLYGKKYFGVSDKKYQDIISRMFHDGNGGRTAPTDTMSISLEFQHVQFGRSATYVVKRSWERGSSGPPSESLDIRITDAKDGGTRASSEQSIIDAILPLGVARLFFFDGEKIQQMAEDGTESAYIKASLDSLFGLDVARQLHRDIGVHIGRNSDSELTAIISEIEKENQKKDELDAKLDRARENQVFKDSEVARAREELAVLEEEFAKLGGKFAERRTELVEKKTVVERETDHLRRQISDMCAGLLPLCMVRDRMASVRTGLEADIKTMHGVSERHILSAAFADVRRRAKSEFGAGTVTKRLDTILSARLAATADASDAIFGFSAGDTAHLQDLMDGADALDLGRLEQICLDLDKADAQLEEIDSSLELAPRQDEVGPLFSKILRVGRDLRDAEAEIENLKDMESQYRSELVLTNATIRKLLGKKKLCVKKGGGLEIAPRIQDVLQEYADVLRNEKANMLAANILASVRQLLHKEDFITNVKIDADTFEVCLYDTNGDEILKDKLSKGELQIYTTSVMWGIAKTSGRAMPFIIDTPLARLDSVHRTNMTEGFYPYASHQILILSTDSEITEEYYEGIRPHVARSMVVRHKDGNSQIADGYFWGGDRQ